MEETVAFGRGGNIIETLFSILGACDARYCQDHVI